MNPNISSPWPIPLWQAFSLVAALASVIFGFFVRHAHIKKVKRQELLKELHRVGEVEILEADLTLFGQMDDFAIRSMINELEAEGIIYEHIVKVMRSNKWESWPVHRLTQQKGVELVTSMFGSAPAPPPESE